MFKNFTKTDKFALACAVLCLILTVTFLALESAGGYNGISDASTFFLGLFVASMGYLFRKRMNKFMFLFTIVCGLLISLLSVVKQILIYVGN